MAVGPEISQVMGYCFMAPHRMTLRRGMGESGYCPTNANGAHPARSFLPRYRLRSRRALRHTENPDVLGQIVHGRTQYEHRVKQSLTLCSVSIICGSLWLDALRREFLPRSDGGQWGAFCLAAGFMRTRNSHKFRYGQINNCVRHCSSSTVPDWLKKQRCGNSELRRFSDWFYSARPEMSPASGVA
jgi:hypothetical protein